MITCTSKKFIHVEEKVYTCPSCTQALEEGPGNLKKILWFNLGRKGQLWFSNLHKLWF